MTVKPNQHWATCENTASRWSCRKSISRSETKSSKVAVFTRLFRFMPSKIIIKVQHSHLGHVSWSGSWCCIKGGVMPFLPHKCALFAWTLASRTCNPNWSGGTCWLWTREGCHLLSVTCWGLWSHFLQYRFPPLLTCVLSLARQTPFESGTFKGWTCC